MLGFLLVIAFGVSGAQAQPRAAVGRQGTTTMVPPMTSDTTVGQQVMTTMLPPMTSGTPASQQVTTTMLPPMIPGTPANQQVTTTMMPPMIPGTPANQQVTTTMQPPMIPGTPANQQVTTTMMPPMIPGTPANQQVTTTMRPPMIPGTPANQQIPTMLPPITSADTMYMPHYIRNGTPVTKITFCWEAGYECLPKVKCKNYMFRTFHFACGPHYTCCNALGVNSCLMRPGVCVKDPYIGNWQCRFKYKAYDCNHWETCCANADFP
ncbi:uncharacterized protein LOC135388293 isoform X2 [Ornithodoros turicata]|uniref:uncharacterized protein LOC135388293 isoform X2 n=1 Tax=Ornithodoros turicata TaxID=34597 RepID=UPI003139DA88